MPTTLLIWSRRLGVQSASLTLIRCQRAASPAREKIVHRGSCEQKYYYRDRIDISRQYSSTSCKFARCKHEQCDLTAGSGWAKDRKPLYCSFHKEPAMEDVRHARCEHSGCSILRPLFGYEPKKGIMCLTHKLPGMENVITPRCEFEGCNILRPCFDLPGSKKGRFCDKHRTADMIDVRDRRCAHEGCDVVEPRYGYLVAKGRLLENLQASGMMFQNYTKCENERCSKMARFGSVVGKPVSCDEHTLSDMKDVISDRCSEHKLEGMVHLDKRCEQRGCRNLASFGMPGGGLQHCVVHKLAGMIQYRGRI